MDASHRHVTPLPTTRRPPDDKLPGKGFIGLIGAFDHATTVPYTATKPDDNHLYLWVRVASGPFAGRYETAVNVHSAQGAGSRDLLYATREQTLPETDWPLPGVAKDAAVSYAGLGLGATDFATVQQDALRSLMLQYASTCARMAVYGMEYVEHTGLHDVHRNPGPKDEDGAVVFYFDADHGGPAARWIFLMFQGEAVG